MSNVPDNSKQSTVAGPENQLKSAGEMMHVCDPMLKTPLGTSNLDLASEEAGSVADRSVTTTSTGVIAAQTIRMVDTDSLKPHELSKEIYGDVVSESFILSIREKGVLVPLLVAGDTVLAGHSRLAAAKASGIAKLPVMETGITDPKEMKKMVLESNSQRHKTAEQRFREYGAHKDIESNDAAQRKAQKGSASLASQKKGKARDLAADKVGLSGVTCENGLKIVRIIDRLTGEGSTDKANALRETLNEKSVSAALEMVKAHETPIKPTTTPTKTHSPSAQLGAKAVPDLGGEASDSELGVEEEIILEEEPNGEDGANAIPQKAPPITEIIASISAITSALTGAGKQTSKIGEQQRLKKAYDDLGAALTEAGFMVD